MPHSTGVLFPRARERCMERQKRQAIMEQRGRLGGGGSWWPLGVLDRCSSRWQAGLGLDVWRGPGHWRLWPQFCGSWYIQINFIGKKNIYTNGQINHVQRYSSTARAILLLWHWTVRLQSRMWLFFSWNISLLTLMMFPILSIWLFLYVPSNIVRNKHLALHS